MKYITSVERLAIERGIQQGMQRGMQKGLETRLAKGRTEGGSALLGRQLHRRFGPLPPSILDRLAQATPEQLEIWAERVLDAVRLEDVFSEN